MEQLDSRGLRRNVHEKTSKSSSSSSRSTTETTSSLSTRFNDGSRISEERPHESPNPGSLNWLSRQEPQTRGKNYVPCATCVFAGDGEESITGNEEVDHDIELDNDRRNNEKSRERSCFFAEEMAEEDQRAEKYIVEIPFSVLLSIYQSLDADRGWEKLAGETGYTFDKIKLLELEGTRSQGSASKCLLWELGSRNTTVRQLYGYLHNCSRFREMKLLEDYVNSPVKPMLPYNGLKGLRAPEFAENGLNGLNTSYRTADKKDKDSLDSDNFNLNQASSSCSDNNSMKFPEKGKRYSSKMIPTETSSSSSSCHSPSARSGPASILVPAVKPKNPSSRVLGKSEVASKVRQMVMPQQQSSSFRSPDSGASDPTTSSSSVSSLPDPASSSSGLTSLLGLDNSLDDQMVLMGSSCFSFAEIVRATDDFSARSKIGEGAFGAVYLAVLRHNRCAVKKMFEARDEKAVVERSAQVKRELSSLLKFRHENIVTLYGYALEGESLCLVYQFMPNGSLEDRIMCKNGTQPLSWSQRLNIFQGACQGLNFLHNFGKEPLIHGDVKSANILLDKHLEAKLGDLGQAQHATANSGDTNTARHTHITRAHASTVLYGTRAYQSLELQTGGRPSTKSDVFSMGVVLLELFFGEKAYDERREGDKFLGSYLRNLKEAGEKDQCLERIDRRGGDCPPEVAKALMDIVDKCTSDRKKDRPTSSVLLHQVKEADELFKEKTGTKSGGLDSMPGSEHSCHLSHTSAAPHSTHNLAAAPTPTRNASTPHKPSNLDNVVLQNSQLSKEKNLADPSHDNRLAVNIDAATKSFNAQTSRQSSQSSSCSSGQSPSVPFQGHAQSSPDASSGSFLECFPKGEPLPPAFAIQRAYDEQAEKKRIERLSQCYSPEEKAQSEGERCAQEALPQTDPAKLAALEQFDRLNLGGGAEEKEPNTLRSDPKKLAALKQFDDAASAKPTEDGMVNPPETLACDPKKLAYLYQYDNGGLPVDGALRQQTVEAESLTSDPRKLAALHADNLSSPGGESSVSGGGQAGRPAHVGRLVSQEDYVVVSQREALEACHSPTHQQPDQAHSASQKQFIHQADLAHGASQEHLTNPQADHVHGAPQTYLTHPQPEQGQGSAQSCLTDSQRDQASNQTTLPSTSSPSPVGAQPSQHELQLRQKNFFDMYNKFREEEDFDEEESNYDEEEENNGEENEEEEEEDLDEHRRCAVQNLSAGVSEGCSPSLNVKDEVRMQALTEMPSRHVPYKQEESEDGKVLNYFREREQHYEKTFKLKPETSH